MTKSCIFCGTAFIARHVRQLACDQPACREKMKERKREQDRTYYWRKKIRKPKDPANLKYFGADRSEQCAIKCKTRPKKRYCLKCDKPVEDNWLCPDCRRDNQKIYGDVWE